MPITANMIDQGLARQQAAARKAAAAPAAAAADQVADGGAAPAPAQLPDVAFVDAATLKPADFDRGYLAAGHASESPANITKAQPVDHEDDDELSPEAQEIQDRLDDAEARIEALPEDATPWTDEEAAAAYADEQEARADAEEHPDHPEGNATAREAAGRRVHADNMRRSARQRAGGMGAIDSSR